MNDDYGKYLSNLTKRSSENNSVKEYAEMTKLLYDFYGDKIRPAFVEATISAAKGGESFVFFVVPRPSPFTKLFWKMFSKKTPIMAWIEAQLINDYPSLNIEYKRVLDKLFVTWGAE